MLGLVADLPGALAAARAVIVPIWEGGGTRLKVLEALAAARAVVATPLGRLRSRLRATAGTGCSASTPRSSRARSPSLLADPQRAAAMGAEGRVLAERYRWPEALAGASALYSRSRRTSAS